MKGIVGVAYFFFFEVGVLQKPLFSQSLNYQIINYLHNYAYCFFRVIIFYC